MPVDASSLAGGDGTRTAFDTVFKFIPVLLLAGCVGPQSTLQPAGPAAHTAAMLWWGMFTVAVAVTIMMTAFWLWAMRPRGQGLPEPQARRLQKRLIVGGGVLLPLGASGILLAFGIPAGHSMLPLATDEPPLRIEVTARQWWWQVHYPDAGVTTANELHLPAGRPVDMHVSSEDVIHSFWVPRLGGKIDMVPGRVNVLRLTADAPGLFRAQCAEFCGLGHAHMHMPVIAHDEAGFRRWLARQQQAAAPSRTEPAVAAAFQAHCGECHALRGVSQGHGGPDLTTVGARRHDILGWLEHHAQRRPALPAPDHRYLAPGQLADIAGWLQTFVEVADD